MPAVLTPKFVPVRVTTVAVPAAPEDGDTLVIVGTATPVYVAVLTALATPLIVTMNFTEAPTETSVPTVAVSDVDEIHVGLLAVEPVPVAPYVTDVIPAVLVPKFVPVNVTTVAVPAAPEDGDTLVIVGVAASYEKSVLAALVPPGVVTSTLAVAPAVPAGVFAATVVASIGVTFVAAVPPIVTPVAPVRLVPVIITSVPPPAGPLAGVIPVTVGAAA
jgi:hypothetical protein